MSSSSSYHYTSSYTSPKGPSYSYSRPSTSSTTYSTTSYSSTSSSSSSASTYQSLYKQSASASSSSRSKRYCKPPVIHNGGGQINDPNTSTSAPNGGYYN